MKTTIGILGIIFILFAQNCIVWKMGQESVMMEKIE